MALNRQTQHIEEAMISKLMDDVLLLILGKVDLMTVMRVSVVSQRWRHLPWLLTQLRIDVKDFLREPYADPTVDYHIEKAMLSLRDATRSMVASRHRKCIISRLCISFFLTNSNSSVVGHLVNEAIVNGMVKDIELTSGVERIPFDCDTGLGRSFRIDAPNSKLSKLEFFSCHSKLVEIVCLPKLEVLISGYWSSPYLSLTLGNVPCLKLVEIYCSTESYQGPFQLSELLCRTRINKLTLDFLGQKVWLQPEKYQLRSAFSNLTRLFLAGIFVGFGLLWIIALLEVAPSLEILHIEVYDHICQDEVQRLETFGERTNGPWEVSESTSHFPLKELLLEGFNATEGHIAFIGAIMGRAPNLRSVILKEQYCKKCAAISKSLKESKYPKNEDEQVAVVNNLRSRFSSRAEITFSDYKFCK